MRFTLLVWVIALLLLAGCLRTGKTGPVTKPTHEQTVSATTSNTNAAVANNDAAHSALASATQERLEQVRANIDNARDGNQKNAEGPAKVFVDKELELGQQRLSDVKPDAEERIRGAEREALIAKGQVAQAQANYAEASALAKAKIDELVSLKVELERTRMERDAAIAAQKKAIDDLVVESKKIQAEYEKQIANLKDVGMREQSRWLTGAGLLLLLIFGACTAFGQLGGLKVSWPFGAMGLMALGLAQIVRQPWFMPACAVCITAGLVIISLWVLRHYKQGNLAAEAQKRAAKLTDVTKQVIPVLDDAYDDATDELKKWLDEKIFNPLGNKMNTDTKATVHLIRAENVQKQT